MIVFAAFWACYHSNICCITGFSEFLSALHITFVPSFPSMIRRAGGGWRGGTQPLAGAVYHPWAGELQRRLLPAAARKALALLSSPSRSSSTNAIWPSVQDVVPVAWLNPHHPTSQFWAAPPCCFSTFPQSTLCLYSGIKPCHESSGVGRSGVSKSFLPVQCPATRLGSLCLPQKRDAESYNTMGRDHKDLASSA